MRLAAYAGALTNLAAQAAERQVTPEDRQLLDSLLLAITELLWKHSTRAALFTTRYRRDLALSALGFQTGSAPNWCGTSPSRAPPFSPGSLPRE